MPQSATHKSLQQQGREARLKAEARARVTGILPEFPQVSHNPTWWNQFRLGWNSVTAADVDLYIQTPAEKGSDAAQCAIAKMRQALGQK